MNSKLLKYILLISAGLLLLVNVPFNLTVAPSRNLTILDNKGNPVHNAVVRQLWDQYALGEGGEQRFRTSRDGTVILPKRTVNTTILSLIKGAAMNFREVGVHASYTSYETVTVWVDNNFQSFYDGKGLEAGKVTYEPEKWSKSLNTIPIPDAAKRKDDLNPFYHSRNR